MNRKLQVLIESRQTQHLIGQGIPSIFIHDRGSPATICYNLDWVDLADNESLRRELKDELETGNLPKFLELAQVYYLQYAACPESGQLDWLLENSHDIPKARSCFLAVPFDISEAIENLLRRGTQGDPFDENLIGVIEQAARYRIFLESGLSSHFADTTYYFHPDFKSGFNKVTFISLDIYTDAVYNYYQKIPYKIQIGNILYKLYKFPHNSPILDILARSSYAKLYKIPDNFSFIYDVLLELNRRYGNAENQIIFPPELSYGDINIGFTTAEDGFELYFLLPDRN